MKDFKDNLEGESPTEAQHPYESQKPEGHPTFWQKLLRGVSRYSLLFIVGIAALSITFLHFKGRYILEVLRGTPLPTFYLEKIIAPKALPDKTKVYEQALKEEEKRLRQKCSLNLKMVKPRWQMSPDVNTKTLASEAVQDTLKEKNEPQVDSRSNIHHDTVELERPQKSQPVKRVRKKAKTPKSVPSGQAIAAKQETDVDFFQPVKVVNTLLENIFFPCSVHGGQEISNNQMLTLRLTEDLTVKGQKTPSGTLVYGIVNLAQNRVQVSVSRILQQAVQYCVHDHTYHEGILLDENLNVWEDAARETAYRQGQRSVRDLPLDVAAELGRSVLQRSKRKQSTVFLPDGYPLYLVNQQKTTP